MTARMFIALLFNFTETTSQLEQKPELVADDNIHKLFKVHHTTSLLSNRLL